MSRQHECLSPVLALEAHSTVGTDLFVYVNHFTSDYFRREGQPEIASLRRQEVGITLIFRRCKAKARAKYLNKSST